MNSARLGRLLIAALLSLGSATAQAAGSAATPAGQFWLSPTALVASPDGKFLLVANHLPAGPAAVDVVAALVSVVDTARAQVSKKIALPNGSGLLRDVRISPDGRHAIVTHQLARFHLPTSQAAAQRGAKLFLTETVGCAGCHPAPLFTDLKRHTVGTVGKYDARRDQIDTPTLIEVWRSSPYLHDGSAGSVREVLTSRNRPDGRGNTSHLTPQQIDDLVEYVLSL